MRAAAADFHDVRLLGFLAVFAAILAVWFGGAITRAVPAFFGRFFSHDSIPRRSKTRSGFMFVS